MASFERQKYSLPVTNVYQDFRLYTKGGKNRHDNATGQIHSSLQIKRLPVSMSVMLGTNSAAKISALQF